MIQKQKRKTWEWFSKYIRLKYADHQGNCTCYTCGAVKPWKKMQAGHGISGRTNNVLFNEDLVRPQCYGCNIMQYGKLDEFGEKLRKEIGSRYSEALKSKYQEKHFTELELKSLEEQYKRMAMDYSEKKNLPIQKKIKNKRKYNKITIISAKLYPSRKRSKEILKDYKTR